MHRQDETDKTEQGEVQTQIKRSAIHRTCNEEDVPAVQRFIGLVRYISNHQYSFLRTDQKPQTFLMQKSPASAPKKLERPFVATSTVWDEIRYKPGKGMLLADTQPRVYMNDR